MLFVLVALAAAPVPTLTFEERVIAKIGPAFAQEVENCSTSGRDWIYLRGAVSYSCPGSPLRSIELTGEAPVDKVLAAPMKRSLRSNAILALIPMWRVSEAQDACKRREKTLPSVPFTATVSCDGAAPFVVPFTVPLELICLSKEPSDKSRFEAAGRRNTTRSLDIGESGKVKLDVRWSALGSTPVSATVVELDAAGEVANRFMVVTPRERDEPVSLEVTLDTSTARRAVLGLELKFDGHTAIKPLMVVFVNERSDGGHGPSGLGALGDVMTNSAAVTNRLWAKFNDPCAKRDEVLAWLRSQPEVTYAENYRNRLSFNIDDMVVPVNCSLKR